MTHRVGIFRFELGLPSEAFIYQQAAALRQYTPSFWCRNVVRPPASGAEVHTSSRFGRAVGKAFAVLPHRLFFSHPAELKKLDLIHAHFAVDACYAMPLAVTARRPFVATLHGYDILSRRTDLVAAGGARFKRFLAQESAMQKACSRFIAVSDFIRKAALKKGYPESKLVRHYIGVDTEAFSPAAAVGNPADRERFILCVGRHVEFKGIDVLLRAFAQVLKKAPDVQLVQVGAGPLFDANVRLAEELGISANVRFLGAQPHDKVLSLMRTATAFCLPSRTTEKGGSEALGIVFCEASSVGLPIVSTLNGGIPEVVQNGETGLLVEENNAAALADAMSQILASSSLQERLGRQARSRMIEHFDIKKQSASLENIYREVSRA